MKFKEDVTGIVSALHQEGAVVRSLWDEIDQNSNIQRLDSDNSLRPIFVELQRDVEIAIAAGLSTGKYEGAVAIVHTKKISTPLRIAPDATNIEELVTAPIFNDPNRLRTVTDRAASVRRMLASGVSFAMVYEAPTTPVSEEVYTGLLDRYSNLLDFPIQDLVADNISGATYLVQKGDDICLFSINSYQAAAAKEDAKQYWGVSCAKLLITRSPDGSVIMDAPAEIKERFDLIDGFLKGNGVYMQQLLSDNAKKQKQELQR